MANIKVTTAYVGANADLVRGFITTILEIRSRPGSDDQADGERPEHVDGDELMAREM